MFRIRLILQPVSCPPDDPPQNHHFFVFTRIRTQYRSNFDITPRFHLISNPDQIRLQHNRRVPDDVHHAEVTALCVQALQGGEVHVLKNDEGWTSRAAQRRRQASGCKYSPAEWEREVRRARQMPYRVFVVMHIFSGPRRAEDVESWVYHWGLQLGIAILMCSCDIVQDAR